MYLSTQQFYDISIRLLCGSIATCFDPVGSTSDKYYMNISFVFGLFTVWIQISDL
jgi:hypothetical protein